MCFRDLLDWGQNSHHLQQRQTKGRTYFMLTSWYLVSIVPCTAAAATLPRSAVCMFLPPDQDNIIIQPAFVLEDFFFMKPIQQTSLAIKGTVVQHLFFLQAWDHLVMHDTSSAFWYQPNKEDRILILYIISIKTNAWIPQVS